MHHSMAGYLNVFMLVRIQHQSPIVRIDGCGERLHTGGWMLNITLAAFLCTVNKIPPIIVVYSK